MKLRLWASLLQLMQLQADAEAVEEEQSILQAEGLNPEEQGIVFVDSDSDDGYGDIGGRGGGAGPY